MDNLSISKCVIEEAISANSYFKTRMIFCRRAHMTWTEYYDNINEWSADMAVEQLCNLTQMGPSDQVADAVYSVSLENEAMATRILDRANEFGVHFTGEDLLTLLDVCKEESFVKAMENSAPWFKKDDLLELYGSIEDDWLIEIIKEHHLAVPEEILEEYEEQLDDGTDKPITWKKFYERFWDWSTDYAIRRLKGVTSYGKSEEIVEVVCALFDYNKAEASAFVNQAVDAGVSFNTDDIDALSALVDEETLRRVVMARSPKMKKKDLENLCGVIPDTLMIEIATVQGLPLPEDLAEYDELVDSGESKPITWKYFYDRFYEWSATYAKKKLEDVTKLGSASQVFEVLTEIFTDDEAGASKFLHRATDEGITFSRDDFSELNMLCDYDSVRRAVLASGTKFKAKDLEYLYGEIEDDIIIEVASKYNLMLPEDLREEEEEDSDEELEEDFEEEEIYFTNDDIKQEIAATVEWANLAIDALIQASNHMNTASNWGVVDMFDGGFFPSILKHSSATDAEQYIQQAQGYLQCMNSGLESILQNKHAHLNFSALVIAMDAWFDDGFMDCLVQLRIDKVRKRIIKAIRQVENVRNELVKAYNQL